MIRSFSRLYLGGIHGLPNFYNSSVSISIKNAVTASAVAASTDVEPKWQIVTAACITRHPVVSPELNQIEKQYKEYLENKEIQLSLLSDHEMRLAEEKIRDELVAKGELEALDRGEMGKERISDVVDKYKKELNQFEFADKITDADKAGDFTTLNRALDRSLVLVAKQKLGSREHWVLPQLPWVPGETLRQSCDRVVKDICGSKVKVRLLGNSPCGFFKYKYPKEVRRNGFIGAKVFFFSGHVIGYDNKGLESSDMFPEHLWLTHEGLHERLGKSYFQAVSQFLIPDD